MKVQVCRAHHGITQFQSVCTALAATVGTGNIAGVAAALVSGGPGAVFWMWILRTDRYGLLMGKPIWESGTVLRTTGENGSAAPLSI